MNPSSLEGSVYVCLCRCVCVCLCMCHLVWMSLLAQRLSGAQKVTLLTLFLPVVHTLFPLSIPLLLPLLVIIIINTRPGNYYNWYFGYFSLIMHISRAWIKIITGSHLSIATKIRNIIMVRNVRSYTGDWLLQISL